MKKRRFKKCSDNLHKELKDRKFAAAFKKEIAKLERTGTPAKDKTLIQEVVQGRKEYQAGGWIPVGRLKKQLKRTRE